MAVLSLIFNRPQRVKIQAPDESGNSERTILIVDSARNISHQFTAQPTEHPVEDGSLIGDHVDIMPRQVSFEGIISEAPLSLEQIGIASVAGAVPTVGGFAGTIGGTIFSGAVATLGGLLLNKNTDRVKNALDALLLVQDERIPLTVITGLQVYNNMILAAFNPVERVNTGASLSFTATFREVKIASAVQVKVPATILDGSVANKASSTVNKGRKTATEASDQVKAKSSSILARIFGI